jgi:hypothetical protein
MDNLKVDLEITDDQADVVLDRAQRKVDDFADRVNRINPKLGSRMALDFDIAERRAAQLSTRLNQIANTRIGGGQFDELTRRAIRAENAAARIQGELSSIRAVAAQTTNASVLTQLETQAKGLERELRNVEFRQKQITSASPGSKSGGEEGNRLIYGLGPLFRATGLYQYGVDESIINGAYAAYKKLVDASKIKAVTEGAAALATGAQAASTTVTAGAAGVAAKAETELAGAAVTAAGAQTEMAGAALATAGAAETAATATGATAVAAGAVTTAFTAAATAVVAMAIPIGVGVALIGLAYKITSDIRAESEKRLEIENKISAAINEQALAYKESKDNLQKSRSQGAGDFEVDRFVESLKSETDTEKLKSKLNDIERLRDQNARYASFSPLELEGLGLGKKEDYQEKSPGCRSRNPCDR